MTLKAVLSFVSALCFVSICQETIAAKWYVAPPPSGSDANPGTEERPFASIQKGIDAASDGDTVIVAQGTYVENIKFNGKNIVLTGTHPINPDIVANTIIDGKQSGSVVTFDGTEGEACVLSGFTIRNGKARYGGGVCGGTDASRTHATIENNVIIENSAWFLPSAFEAGGGGLAFCDGVITRNRICDNVGDGYGGGLFQCHGTIANNIIMHNSALNASGLARCQGVIRNNIIAGNSAESGGTMFDCNGAILNNTISGNACEGRVGGLCVCQGTISNCIIWGNRGATQLSSCSVPMYSCIQGWEGGGRGNISYYPYFVDAKNEDYHLKSWSPCIDAGDPTSPFFLEPQPNGGRINMGAYGNTPEATSKSPDTDTDQLPDAWEMAFFGELSQGRDGDFDGDKVPNIEEYRRGSDPSAVPHWYVDGSVASSGDGASWGRAFKTIREGIDAASHGDTVIVAKGTYVEDIHLDAKNIVLRSTDPLDSEVVASTVIEGNEYGPVVRFSGMEDESCVLSGFTIRGGIAEQGAGICGGTEWDHTHATIQNNVITGNRAEAWGGGYGGGLAYCDGAIQNNTISGNRADFGGGLLCCHGTIQNNTISGNSATGVFHRGGGLYDCDGTIQNNTITDNEATDGGGGLSMCDGTIRNNIIAGNSAHHGGGLETCRGMIQNNTICDNSAEYSAGGLDYCRGIIVNCIVWGNRGFGQLSDSSEASYSCIEGWTAGGEGNIADNPLFVDPDGPDGDIKTYADNDYHLRPDSPCVDAGTHKMVTPPNTDVDGEWRPFGEEIDIGADECVDADRDGLPDYWEVNWFGMLWLEAEDDADADGLSNGQEFLRGTNPQNRDTDSDGKSDGDEVFAGTDPLDSKSVFRVIEIAHTLWGTGLRWSAAPMRSYRCHFSCDLKTWHVLGGTVTAGPSDSSLSVFDWSSVAAQRYYYKVEVLP